MKLNIILLIICVNSALGLQSIPGTPIYAAPDQQCFYPISQSTTYPSGRAPVVDPAVNQFPNGSGINSTEDLVDETTYPSNNTFVNGTWIGSLSDQFNSITEPFEQVYKTGETFKLFLKSNYVVDVVDNFNPNCYVAANGSIVYQERHPVWVAFTDGVRVIMGVLTVIMIFYIVTGRGFLLSS
jgi:hypothetical protein